MDLYRATGPHGFLQPHAKYHPDIVALYEEQWTLLIRVNKEPDITIQLIVKYNFLLSINANRCLLPKNMNFR